MNENLKAIMHAASEDEELMSQVSALMNELNAANDETRPEVVAHIVAFANDRGYELTEEDLVVEAPEEGKIEDEQLALASGGCDEGNGIMGFDTGFFGGF